MRLSWRQLANLAVVVTLGLVATGWALVRLVDVDPFGEPAAHVQVLLSESGGALSGAEVTYLGVQVGKVASTQVVEEGVLLDLEVRPLGPMARELRADVRQKTSLGEPYVDLSPAGQEVVAADRVDGASVPLDRTSVPPPLGELLLEAEELLAVVDPADVNAVAEGASGLVGHENDLQRALTGFADLGAVLDARETELARLLSSSARLTETLQTRSAELDRALSSGARLAEVLAENRAELTSVLREAAQLGHDGSRLLAEADEDVDGVLDGLETTVRILAERPTKVHEILTYTPRFVTEIGLTFDHNAAWSSTQGVPGIPASPTYGVPLSGSHLRLDRIVLPMVIERIVLDGRGFPPAVVLLSPEEAAEAARGTEDYRRVQQQKADELMTTGRVPR